jgi:hypothetical protein
MDEVTPIRKPEVPTDVGGPVDETHVSLALYSVDLEPETVSARLGCAPTHSGRKGERRSERSRPYARGFWLLTVEAKAPTGPDELVKLLLERFPRDEQFWAELRRDYTVQVRFAVHTGGWNRGFDLSPDAAKLLAGTGATLVFDLYLYGDEES